MEQLVLKRIGKTDVGTFGVILQRLNQGVTPIFTTLEPKEPIIPEGTYICSRYLSPKRNKEVYLVNNVPGHSFVELHVGNRESDTDGCVVFGKQFGKIYSQNGENNGVLYSRDAFGEFMSRFKGNFQLEVVNAY